jgi:hypothetical protein
VALISISVEQSCFGVVNERVSYFRNPSYPLSDSLQNYCTFNEQVDFILSFDYYFCGSYN